MILFLKNLKNYKLNQGMSYVELIVVLSIFAIMSSLVIFNHGEFQARVDIKNLSNDVALKAVEAQKASVFGKFPSSGSPPSTWKPSYGLYIDPGSDNTSFIYFVDLNNNGVYEGSDCSGECMEKVSITKGNFISSLDMFYLDESTHSIDDATLYFKRPDSGLNLRSSTALGSGQEYVQVTLESPKSVQSNVKLYLSGRVQVK